MLALAGCGGGGGGQAEEPKLPRGLAQGWAGQARAIADRLDADDACGARDLALALQQRTIRDIDRVPARFREDLQAGVNDLAERTAKECASAQPETTPPPPPPPPPASTSTKSTTTAPRETEPTEPTKSSTHETTEQTETIETQTEPTTAPTEPTEPTDEETTTDEDQG